ncbi:hypothetical protein [Edaphobacter aggregans]|uniref:hypothetical protein n=1 Tax=Edaphobacter aggregans TaxID=570835 RepID=UPI000553EBA2|nr:hypothetical protein [Edaphobacter aggregans]
MPEQTQAASADSPKPKLPRLASDWVRYLLGFTVSVGVGLAPYLGLVGVPLFTPLLSLIPLSLQNTAIPISIASMGIIAVVVQWRRQAPAKPLEFRLALTLALVTLLLFISLEILAVAHIEVPAVDQTVSFAVGFQSPQRPPCENLSRNACIAQRLGFDEALIDGYFGDTQTRLTKLALLLTYIGFMSAFGWMVGLLLVRERDRQQNAL